MNPAQQLHASLMRLSHEIGTDIRSLRKRLEVLETAGFSTEEASKSLSDFNDEVRSYIDRVARSAVPTQVQSPPPAPPPMQAPTPGSLAFTWVDSLHALSIIFWLVMAYPAVVYWHSSVEYLVGIVTYAIVVNHLEGWYYSRVARRLRQGKG